MALVAEHRKDGSRRRGSTLILAAIVAALMMATAAPASATPNVAQSWGQNGDGTLGNGGGESRDVPVAVSKLSGVTEIASERGTVFYGQALALLEGGSVMAWGRNENGEVGDGTKTNKNEPVAVCAVAEVSCAKHLSGVKAVAAGANHSMALLENGTVVQWGKAGDGTVGLVPAEKIGLSKVKAIEAGHEYSLALLENGTVMAWGENVSGQLGNGTEVASSTPMEVCAVGEKAPCAKHLSAVKAVAAGAHQSLALLENGTVVAWGSNGNGELGNGTTTSSSVPVVVCAVGATSPCSEESQQLKGVSAIAGGQVHSMALLESGTVVDWGRNGQGELGNGTKTGSSVPVAVCAAGEIEAPCAKDLEGVKAIAAGGESEDASYALLSSGEVRSWGSGSWHELGDGSTKEDITPVAVCASGEPETSTDEAPCTKHLSNVVGIAGGDEQGFAFGPFPTVTAISPKEGSEHGGTKVTITGTGFSGATEVRFGSTKATSFKVNSETSIEAMSPAGKGTVFVTVTTPAGTTGTSSSDQFTYTPSPLPEVGRCVKVGAKKGQYRGAQCTVSEPGNGSYNWLLGPGAAKKFTATAGATELETVGKSKGLIRCSASKFTGEYTGAKTETATVLLSGCKLLTTGQSCQSNPTKAGEIETAQALEGELGFIKGAIVDPVAGWDLKHAPTLFAFACGQPPESTVAVSIEGSVIAPVHPERMTTETTLKYTMSASGIQSPERFEGGPKDTLTTTFVSGAEKTVEQSGLRAKVLSKSEEPLEIRTECTGIGC